MSKDNDLKKRSGAEIRAQVAARTRPVAAPVKSRREQLDEYREVVVAGQRNFVAVGTALGLIAKDRLFKEAGFASFDAMVVSEFDMTTSTAYRLVDAARVVTILSQVGTIESKISNQSQALALAPLVKDREAMVLVITAAEARGGRLTASLLTEVAVELYPHIKVIDGEVVKDALPSAKRPAIAGKAEAPQDPVDAFPAVKDAIQKTFATQAAAADLTMPAADDKQNRASNTGSSAAGPTALDPAGPAVNPEDHRDLDHPGETDDEAAQPSSGPSAPAGVSGADGQTESATEHAVPSGPQLAEEVEEQAPAGVPAPAPAPIPSWLRAVTAVNTAIYDLRQEDPHAVQLLIPAELAGELGASIKALVTFYKAMHEDVLGGGSEAA